MTTFLLHDLAVHASDFLSEDPMLSAFRLSLEELEEELNRLERDCIGSLDEKIARREINELNLTLNDLTLRRVRLRKWIRSVKKASK
jgi:hypothetical protein